MKNLLPKRPKISNKSTFGHVLNIAGSEFYTGAAYFSSISALKVGCGLVTLVSEATALQAVASLTPDVMFFPFKKINKDSFNRIQAVSIGCGFFQDKKTLKMFIYILNLLKDLEIPIIIDAGGLSILSKFQQINLPQNLILTPHPKELSKLMDTNIENILTQPEFWLNECCKKYNCTTVLKLHETLIADNRGNFYKNNTGNSALAHGGSGDVLCGMISGFLAQGLNYFEACCLAVYLHGLSGEIASKDLTEYSVLASDLLKYIPEAIKTLL